MDHRDDRRLKLWRKQKCSVIPLKLQIVHREIQAQRGFVISIAFMVACLISNTMVAPYHAGPSLNTHI